MVNGSHGIAVQKTVMSVLEKVANLLSLRVGNGQWVHFWSFAWCDGPPLSVLFRDLYGLANRKEDLVAKLWSLNQDGVYWNLGFIRSFNYLEVNAVNGLFMKLAIYRLNYQRKTSWCKRWLGVGAFHMVLFISSWFPRWWFTSIASLLCTRSIVAKSLIYVLIVGRCWPFITAFREVKDSLECFIGFAWCDVGAICICEGHIECMTLKAVGKIWRTWRAAPLQLFWTMEIKKQNSFW